MIRVILGLKRHNHNIHEVRKKIGMMSINQLAVYHTLLESYNIVRNSASEQIKLKWTDDSEKIYTLRSSTNSDLKVPEKKSQNAQVLHIWVANCSIFYQRT